MTELGKHGKYMGEMHPRDLRRLDPKPPVAKTPGKAKTGKKSRKLFGYTFQARSLNTYMQSKRRWKTHTHYTWYATEKQRDDAMKAAGGYYRSFYEIRNVTPIKRGAERTKAEPT